MRGGGLVQEDWLQRLGVRRGGAKEQLVQCETESCSIWQAYGGELAAVEQQQRHWGLAVCILVRCCFCAFRLFLTGSVYDNCCFLALCAGKG